MTGKHTLILAMPSAEGWKPIGGMIDLKDGVASTTNVIDERVSLWIEALEGAMLELKARRSILQARQAGEGGAVVV